MRLYALLCLVLTAACSPEQAPAADARPTYAVIPKGTTHVFWKAVERGAREAGAEQGVELVWKGPLAEDDRAQQIALVQQFTARRVAGIALAPLDRAALLPSVRAARAAGIPVVIFDSALDGEAGVDFATLIATDNRAAGRLAGAELARLLGGEGEVVVLRYVVGSASTHEREEGALEALRAQSGIRILSDQRYAGATVGEAKTAALNGIDTLKAAKGVFTSNESATLGMLLALRQEGLAGKLQLVGFDASPPLVEALRAGEIAALVVQDPRRMGRLSVEALETLRKGGTLAGFTDTGAVLVTREKLDDPAIARLLE
jgi:ribose transport system substrate-binding protein